MTNYVEITKKRKAPKFVLNCKMWQKRLAAFEKAVATLGKKYGRLKVVSVFVPVERGYYEASVQCECGKRKRVGMQGIYSGSTQSCGCLGVERRSAGAKKAFGHFPTADDETLQKTRLARAKLHGMWDRCYNEDSPRYHRYGGRGIKIHKKFNYKKVGMQQAIQNLWDCIGLPPFYGWHIDRINNNGNYAPGNLQWLPPKESAKNKDKCPSTLYLTHKKQTLTIREWVEKVGLPHTTVYSRVKHGWTAKEALTTPRYGRRG